MLAVPALGLGMIATGVALGKKPAPTSPLTRRLVKRSDLVPSTREEPRTSRVVSFDAPHERPPDEVQPRELPVPWFQRLDATLLDPNWRTRCALAESLGTVRAPWAGAFLRKALEAETEPRVRARMLAALFRGLHLEPADVFIRAIERGGNERAVVEERLNLLEVRPPWASQLEAISGDGLAPFCAPAPVSVSIHE